MAATLTGQVHLPPHTGENMTLEGDGLHTRFAFDLVREINNLGTYCNPKPVYLQGSQGGYVRSAQLAAIDLADREVFVAQGLTIAPRGAKRLLWTAGVRPYNVAGTDPQVITVKRVTLYVASQHYAGAVAPTAFDTSALTLGYRQSQSGTFSEVVYKLADMSASGLVQPYPLAEKNTGTGDLVVNLIVTATVDTDNSTDPYGYVQIEDFTAWWVFE